MARPSQNIDQRLLASGLALLPLTGCRGLSARKLTDHAGVHLGMFHYHFHSKENFIRILLEQVYEGMFSELEIRTRAGESAAHNLRNAVHVIAGFGRTHRQLLLRIGADALAGEAVAAQFLQTNLPRHLDVVARLISEAQRDGDVIAAPLPQVIGFIAGAVMGPVLLGTAVLEQALLGPALGELIDNEVLSVAAVEQRIDLALRGLTPLKQGVAE
ncbi:TetR/AcrR family transcriptional regulator [Noviherbaspirillum saxi]|uniref:TetR/AcrR family transcriptional regulator n=1 Tax=Noviherbaspirillum saxi TaxID=2320863 RepID=A0A3A3FRU3_9BURK|nr:TetR/AcrR family transcriptional regulator [Noviherbaspirillum saxi]RJF97178.1 TetR/AcrR family transcriptional regulator [Noviherbaspirillum saxi]